MTLININMATTEIIPALFDPHVHFRTPDQVHKEDFDTGSSAALAGGYFGVIDMPNNQPNPIINIDRLKRKMELAVEQSRCHIGFHLGTLGDEDQDFKSCEPYVFGLKIYMNNTTGGYIVSDPLKLNSIFKRWDFHKPILVHAEGDTLSTAINLAEKYDRRLHVCHVSLEHEVNQIDAAKQKRPDKVTSEVTPHHLLISSHWAADVYKQMKPPLSGFKDMDILWKALRNGTIDIVATDHAPHTCDEKEGANPPSGVTGLETTIPVLFMAERVNEITLERIIEATHTKPMEIFGIPENKEDTYIEVKRNEAEDEAWVIDGKDLKTKPKTTPFQGARVLDRVREVVIEGKTAYRSGEVIFQPGEGRVIYQAS